MRILILGGDGMLGHQLLKHFRKTHETQVTLRRPLADYAIYGLFDAAHAFDGVDVSDFDHIKHVCHIVARRIATSSSEPGYPMRMSKRKRSSCASGSG